MSDPDVPEDVPKTGELFLAAGHGQFRQIRDERNHYKNPAFNFWYSIIFVAGVFTPIDVLSVLSKGHSSLYHLALIPPVITLSTLFIMIAVYLLRRPEWIHIAQQEKPQWRKGRLAIDARLLPIYLWFRASIDVRLNGFPILQTNGQPGAKGKYSAAFDYDDQRHIAELSWTRGNAFYIPYVLSINGQVIEDSRAIVRNWFMLPTFVIFLGFVFEAVFFLVSYLWGLKW